MTRSVQLHCICGTVFLQTELIFWIHFPVKPDLSSLSQARLAKEIITHGNENGHSCKPNLILIFENGVTQS